MASSSAVPGVVGPFCGARRAMAAQDARRGAPRSSVPDLGSVRPRRRGAGTTANSMSASAALAAGLAKRGIKQGDYVLIHLDNCVEAIMSWFACVELGAIAVTTNTRSAAAEIEYFAGHCGAVAAITQPAYAELISANCKGLRWIAVISHDAGQAPVSGARPRRQF